MYEPILIHIKIIYGLFLLMKLKAINREIRLLWYNLILMKFFMNDDLLTFCRGQKKSQKAILSLDFFKS